MKKFMMVLVLAMTCTLGSAKEKNEPKKLEPKKLKSALKFAVPEREVGTLTVICNYEHGDLIYYAHATAMGKSIGGIPFVLHQPESCPKREDGVAWKEVGEYKIPDLPEILAAWCDPDPLRGNLIYLALLHYGETDFGYDIPLVYKSETCMTPPLKNK